ncbi:F-box only protein 40-like [Gouania willdenowi]|uniref:F-box only protein 40-like n=1 Tax=Gouania willdenowi TaxID=441366 RepID=A0A8C5GWC5_GOUWI|nr:F-box only protein 40-like [Gouania willdenowi]
MRRRSGASRSKQHVHCDSCYSRRCRARVKASESCALVPCHLLCGALYHLCKEEDHLLLCPNVREPCINAEYGCSAHMPRSSRAAHLQVCPASVVCCSMDWLRWPVDDTNPHSCKALQDNVLKESKEQQVVPLDLATALVDQSDLYSRLKMKPLYPELMEEEEEEEEVKNQNIATGGLTNLTEGKTNIEDLPENSQCDSAAVKDTEPVSVASINVEKHKLFEMMFSMDKRACEIAEQNLNNPEQNTESKAKARSESAQDHKEKKMLEESMCEGQKDKEEHDNCPTPDTSKIGQAPWQEGVMDRLKQDLTPQEYNMYVVHHGRMLLAFGQIEACTPRDKDFVYGSLEPIPVQTLRSFKIPDSYRYRRRVHLYDTASRVPTETHGVDTSDLAGNEDDWFNDEATTTLLGYAEKEVMGHKISEPKAADALYYDTGTQTHLFHSAPFKRRTTLSEVTEGKPLKLHLQLQMESVTSRHNRGSSVFTFICGHTFHRSEFATHFRNVHCDIQTSLSGWFQERCPLAYLGCTYSQRRFQPATQQATVIYNQDFKTFNLRPTLDDENNPPKRAMASSRAHSRRGGSGTGGEQDSLSSLPYEVLCHMARFLDSLSLSQLALVSRLMRQVCSSLLQDRGMVTLHWERKSYSHGGIKWRAKPVWQFSHLFSAVDLWQMTDTPPMSAHLRVCPYYEASARSEPVPLPSMTEKKQSCNQQRMRLVNLFRKDGR